MKRRLLYISSILVISMLISSCTNDFNTNAPYKNIPVVHAVFTQELVRKLKDQNTYSPTESITTSQDLKITKVFQGNGNYYEYAKIWDSVYYKEGVIDVSIEAIDDKYPNAILAAKYAITDNKESGDFAFPRQLVYRIDSIDVVRNVRPPINNANVGTDLKLKVYNNNRKTEAWATTKLITEYNIEVNSPTVGVSASFINFDISVPGLNTNLDIRKLSSVVGRVGVEFIYEYTETPRAGGASQVKTIVWDWGSQTVNGQQSIKYTVANTTFYDMLAASIPKDETVTRVSGRMFYIRVQAFSTDLNNYIVANSPENMSLGGTSSYTNIKNGIGVFGSKLIKTQEFQVDQRTVTEIKKLFNGIDHSFD